MAYVTGSELTAYAAARGVSLIGDADQLVIRAHDYVDGSSFIGTKTDPLQADQWPRENATIDGYLIPNNVIPDFSGGGSVVKMSYETAISIDQGNDPLVLVDNSVKKTVEKVDVIMTEIEYTDQGRENVISPSIERAAYKLLSAENNGISFKVFN
jgi:hypothetical protein